MPLKLKWNYKFTAERVKAFQFALIMFLHAALLKQKCSFPHISAMLQKMTLWCWKNVYPLYQLSFNMYISFGIGIYICMIDRFRRYLTFPRCICISKNLQQMMFENVVAKGNKLHNEQFLSQKLWYMGNCNNWTASAETFRFCCIPVLASLNHFPLAESFGAYVELKTMWRIFSFFPNFFNSIYTILTFIERAFPKTCCMWEK